MTEPTPDIDGVRARLKNRAGNARAADAILDREALAVITHLEAERDAAHATGFKEGLERAAEIASERLQNARSWDDPVAAIGALEAVWSAIRAEGEGK